MFYVILLSICIEFYPSRYISFRLCKCNIIIDFISRYNMVYVYTYSVLQIVCYIPSFTNPNPYYYNIDSESALLCFKQQTWCRWRRGCQRWWWTINEESYWQLVKGLHIDSKITKYILWYELWYCLILEGIPSLSSFDAVI